MEKIFARLVLRVGSIFFAQSNPQHKVPSLTSKKYFHVGIHVILENIGLGTVCNGN